MARQSSGARAARGVLPRFGLRRGTGRGDFGDLDLHAVAREPPTLAFLLGDEVRRRSPHSGDPLERLARARELEVAAVVVVDEQELALAFVVVGGELDLRQPAPGELLEQLLLHFAERTLEDFRAAGASVLAVHEELALLR